MGTRGPKPTPSAVKLARGTFRRDRAAGNEATPLGKPTCPKWVTDPDAKREFRRLVKHLGDMGLIGAADQNQLVRYVLTWVRWRRVVQTLAANASAEFAMYRDEKGTVKSVQVSALHSVARSLADELSRAESVLGMNPSARSRIEAAPPSPVQSGPDKSRFFDAPMRMAN